MHSNLLNRFPILHLFLPVHNEKKNDKKEQEKEKLVKYKGSLRKGGRGKGSLTQSAWNGQGIKCPIT